MKVLGIDIGTAAIKACIFDTTKGKYTSEIVTKKVKEGTSPHKIVSRVHQIVSSEFAWRGPIGIAIPESVRRGRVLSARRLDSAWEDMDATDLFSEVIDTDVYFLNDADAGGIAELHVGAGKNEAGVVMFLTVGTGIGSALFIDGQLVPNTELGLIELRGISAQDRASNKSRKEEGINRKAWSKRLEFVLNAYEQIFHPDLFIIGGQLSKNAEKTLPYIKIQTPVKPAAFENDASMVGAALVAADQKRDQKVFYL